MDTRVMIIRPEILSEEIVVDLPARPGYAELAPLIRQYLGESVTFEHVSVLHEGRGRDMIVDEDGLSKGLQRNEAATSIYRTHWLRQHPGESPESIAYIVGTALLFNRRVWY